MAYTFNKREKVLVGVLAVIVVIMAWYLLVFNNCNNQIMRLTAEAQETQTSMEMSTTKLNNMNRMQAAIDEAKAKGVKPVTMPKYDNFANVVATLNSQLAGTSAFNLAFDEVSTSSNVVERGVTITFGCGSYDEAKAIILGIQDGPYSCSVDDVTLTNSATAAVATGQAIRSAGAAAGTTVSATIHVVYYETNLK